MLDIDEIFLNIFNMFLIEKKIPTLTELPRITKNFAPIGK